MTPLTVACLFVDGEYPYTPEYVFRLREMITRWADRAFDFVCLTDRPHLLPGIETRTVQRFPDCFAYWNKLQVFDVCRCWSGRILYLDLDTLIVAPLEHIIDYPADFVITSDLEGKTGRDKYGRQIVRRFNSSVMAWDAGTHYELYDQWELADSSRLSGDQDWIGEQLPDAAVMPRAWFPRLSEVTDGPPFGEAKVILTKHPKNAIAVDKFDWFAPLWGAA